MRRRSLRSCSLWDPRFASALLIQRAPMGEPPGSSGGDISASWQMQRRSRQSSGHWFFARQPGRFDTSLLNEARVWDCVEEGKSAHPSRHRFHDCQDGGQHRLPSVREAMVRPPRTSPTGTRKSRKRHMTASICCQLFKSHRLLAVRSSGPAGMQAFRPSFTLPS